MNGTIINDLDIRQPFRVFDMSTGSYIFSLLRLDQPGDIPPDIAMLPVIGTRKIRSDSGSVLYIDTVTR